MKIGASTFYGISNKSVLESVKELERKGFQTIELMYEFNNLIKQEEIIQLKKKKLDLSMHCPFIGTMFTHLNPSFSLPQIKLIEKSLKVACKLKCSHYVMHGGKIPFAYSVIENPKNKEFFTKLFIKRFKNIFKKYSTKGVKILIENMVSPKDIGGQIEDIKLIQKSIPEVGFCFDIAHSEVSNQTNQIIKDLKIDYVHATDNNLKMDLHMTIGKGKINYKNIIKKIKNKGFNGKIILENSSFEECVESRNNLRKII